MLYPSKSRCNIGRDLCKIKVGVVVEADFRRLYNLEGNLYKSKQTSFSKWIKQEDLQHHRSFQTYYSPHSHQPPYSLLRPPLRILLTNKLSINSESFPRAQTMKTSPDGDNGVELSSDRASEKAEIPEREVKARAEN
ncbi:hypothetical protein L2E82_13763 [Cichorium intybus]|uniref:Uncharacterized protein n=1 Tax=Cichorium intybus TaxID=13427 RepID=A0ACB9EZB4_CICIN|nr:hypothetical protein L2E82_13763 [Cichorium intybus]